MFRAGQDIRAWLLASSIPEPNSGCWLWLGWCTKYGYGKPGKIRGTNERYAHRISFTAFVGSIPTGLSVLHKCDTPCCINPGHLFLGDHQMNMLDMRTKGRSPVQPGSSNGMSKLTDDAVRAIRRLRSQGATIATLIVHFGVSSRTIRDASIGGRFWLHVNSPARAPAELAWRAATDKATAEKRAARDAKRKLAPA